eukprot:jgi/Mesvir1/17301/Mv07700-RA.1
MASSVIGLKDRISATFLSQRSLDRANRMRSLWQWRPSLVMYAAEKQKLKLAAVGSNSSHNSVTIKTALDEKLLQAWKPHKHLRKASVSQPKQSSVRPTNTAAERNAPPHVQCQHQLHAKLPSGNHRGNPSNRGARHATQLQPQDTPAPFRQYGNAVICNLPTIRGIQLRQKGAAARNTPEGVIRDATAPPGRSADPPTAGSAPPPGFSPTAPVTFIDNITNVHRPQMWAVPAQRHQGVIGDTITVPHHNMATAVAARRRHRNHALPLPVKAKPRYLQQACIRHTVTPGHVQVPESLHGLSPSSRKARLSDRRLGHLASSQGSDRNVPAGQCCPVRSSRHNSVKRCRDSSTAARKVRHVQRRRTRSGMGRKDITWAPIPGTAMTSSWIIVSRRYDEAIAEGSTMAPWSLGSTKENAVVIMCVTAATGAVLVTYAVTRARNSSFFGGVVAMPESAYRTLQVTAPTTTEACMQTDAPSLPATGMQTDAPSLPATGMQTDAPSLPATGMQTDAPSLPATGMQTDAPSLPATGMQTDAPSLPATGMQTDAPSLPATGMQTDAPSLPATGMQTDAPSLPATGMQTDAPSLPATGMQTDAPSLPATGMQTDAPSLPATGMQTDAPSLPATGMQTDAPSLPATGMQTDAPSLPATGMQTDAPASQTTTATQTATQTRSSALAATPAQTETPAPPLAAEVARNEPIVRLGAQDRALWVPRGLLNARQNFTIPVWVWMLQRDRAWFDTVVGELRRFGETRLGEGPRVAHFFQELHAARHTRRERQMHGLQLPPGPSILDTIIAAAFRDTNFLIQGYLESQGTNGNIDSDIRDESFSCSPFPPERRALDANLSMGCYTKRTKAMRLPPTHLGVGRELEDRVRRMTKQPLYQALKQLLLPPPNMITRQDDQRWGSLVKP